MDSISRRNKTQRRCSSPLWLTAAACVVASWDGQSARAEETVILKQMVTFIQETCVECHGGRATKAGVDLSKFRTELDVWKDRPVWTRAQLMVAEGKMPPDTEEPISEKERVAVARWIQETLENVDVERIPRDPGFVPPRRLTGDEYNYTVKDLFGLDQDSVYEFPADLVIGDSFENEANTLTVEALWFEKALEAADAAVRAVWDDTDALDRLLVVRPTPPPAEDEALYVASPEVSRLCDTGAPVFTVLIQVTGQPERLFLRSPRGVDEIRGAKELAFDDDALVYRISRSESLRAEGLELTEEGTHWVGLTVRHGQATLYLDGRLLASRSGLSRPDFDGHLLKIGTAERERRRREEQPSPERIERFLFFANGLPDEVMLWMARGAAGEDLPEASFTWVAGMETPQPEGFVSVENAGRIVLRRFLSQAFRRPPSVDVMNRYTGLLEEGLEAGLVFEVALQHPVATALSSPAFLFRSEAFVDSDGAYPVPGIELASRLSYFLWSSLPDEALRESAESGELTSRDELLRQTERLLADKKAQRFFESFALQWLRTQGLGDTIRPDGDRFPEVSEALLASMRREGVVVFANAVLENRPLLNLLEAPTTFMDEALATHYGYPGIVGPEWREVRLKDATRGGILTQAAVLTVSSSPRRTSPVFRGKWVLEVLLGEPPPPPPANVPALPAEVEPGGTSLRELLEAHRGQEACAGCHNRIDPYGLALEQYDAVGRLRPTKQDTATTLSTGESLDGVEDLKRYLVRQKKSAFLRHLTRKMLSYALGRELRFPDERTVHAIHRKLENGDGGARTLIHEVVLSEPFRYRKNPARRARF